jgi:hypothetical protein
MNNYDQNLFIEDDTHISFQNDLDIWLLNLVLKYIKYII